MYSYNYIQYSPIILLFFRRLNESELENIVLKSQGKCHSRLRTHCSTIHKDVIQNGGHSLLRCIKIVKNGDLQLPLCTLGSGSFGTCFLQKFCHFDVCVKVFKPAHIKSLIQEANVLSKFNDPHLPYLFGVSMDAQPSIVTSFHGISHLFITVHDALFPKSKDVKSLVCDASWIEILLHIIQGLQKLHEIWHLTQ